MGDQGPKPGYEYGMPALHEIFYNADFPLGKQDIIDMYGDRVIEYKQGNPVSIKDLLKDVPNRSFSSERDLEEVLRRKL